MQNKGIKLFITIVASAVIAIRYFQPEITLDNTTIMLVALALLPWLSQLVKSFEGFGLKVEFQDAKRALAKNGSREGVHESPVVPSTTVGVRVAPDDFFVRLLKLTPIEMVIIFIVTNPIVQLTGSAAIQWAYFILLAAITPLYYWRLYNAFKLSHLIVTTIWFVVWIFAIGGPFTMLEWYTPLIGAMALLVTAVISPLFVWD